MIRVELPVVSVSNDLWMFRAGAVLLLYVFFQEMFLIVLKKFFCQLFFCELVIRVERQITRFAFTRSTVPYLSALFIPDVRFRQKLSKVAEALKSGRSSKKWRKLDQVVSLKVVSKNHKKKNDANSKHPQMYTCKMTVVPR